MKLLILISLILFAAILNPWLSIPFIVLLLVISVFKHTHKHNNHDNRIVRELLFRRVHFNGGRDVKNMVRSEVLDKLLLVYDNFGFTVVYGGILFSNVYDYGILKSILLKIPLGYFLILRYDNDFGEKYSLILSAKCGVYDKSNTLSKVIDLLNSLSISIPAGNIKIMGGHELLSLLLPQNCFNFEV
ncbi:MAG: hypothetical protein QXI93_04040 [Candidatus Methanomethylicia archaeon]